jgi:hypothetical protein
MVRQDASGSRKRSKLPHSTETWRGLIWRIAGGSQKSRRGRPSFVRVNRRCEGQGQKQDAALKTAALHLNPKAEAPKQKRRRTPATAGPSRHPEKPGGFGMTTSKMKTRCRAEARRYEGQRRKQDAGLKPALRRAAAGTRCRAETRRYEKRKP